MNKYLTLVILLISSQLDGQTLPVKESLSHTKLAPSFAHYTSQFILGKVLFSDKALSGDRQSSCASCHIDEANQTKNGRQIPNLWNIHHEDFKRYFWDGRVVEGQISIDSQSGTEISQIYENPTGLELAIYEILTNPQEMLGTNTSLNRAYQFHPEIFSRELLVRLLKEGTSERQEQYRSFFGDAYIGLSPDEATIEHVVKALAYYLKGAFRTNPSKWDLYLDGLAPLTKKEASGALVFKENCHRCHSGPLFSDFEIHDVGSPEGPLRTPPP